MSRGWTRSTVAELWCDLHACPHPVSLAASITHCSRGCDGHSDKDHVGNEYYLEVAGRVA